MRTPWTGLRLLRRVTIGASIILCAVMGALLIAAAVAPEEPLSGPLSAFWDRRSWQVVTVAVAATAALVWLVSLGGARRRGARPLITIVALGASAVILGFASYLNCAADAVPFWSPLTWSIALFFGTAADPFGHVPGCSAPQPLALVVARLLAIATVGLGFAAAVGVVFRAQLDTLRTRRARSRIVFDGPLEVTLPAAATIRSGAASNALVIVRAGANDPPPPLQRQPRVVVLRSSDSVDVALRTFAMRGGRIALDSLYLLSPDTGINITRFERLSEHLEVVPRRSEWHVRAIVRIDDVWLAEYWRRAQVDRRGWAADAIGLHEATAERLVSRWMAAGNDRVAVYGEAGLVLAIAARVAQRTRELMARRSNDGIQPPRIVIVGPDAGKLRDHHALHQRAFGNELADIDALVCDDVKSGFVEALAGAASPAVMTSSGVGSIELSPTELAASHPEWPVYAQVSHGGPIPAEPVMERLYPFSLSFSGFAGADRWERAAQIAHANFLHDNGEQLDVPSRRPWDDGLPEFYKKSNIRLIRVTLASAVAVGRSWGPLSPGVDPRDVYPTDAQIDLMAEREHESWRAHHRASGWRFARHRDEARRTHPLLVAWAELDEENRSKTRVSVRDALALLRALGYVSRPASIVPPGWARYRRRGEVMAERVGEPWTWITESGSTMQTDAGDWRVRDGERVWSVRAAEFAATYEPAADGRWRRRGVVSATRVAQPEWVTTLEGQTQAAVGDWIVQGAGGERWVVPDEHFEKAYTPQA